MLECYLENNINIHLKGLESQNYKNIYNDVKNYLLTINSSILYPNNEIWSQYD